MDRNPRRPALWAAAGMLCLCLTVTPALAQDPGTAAAPAPADSAVAPDVDLEGRLEPLVEQVQTLKSDVDKLKKFKFSGYMQARCEIGRGPSRHRQGDRQPGHAHAREPASASTSAARASS